MTNTDTTTDTMRAERVTAINADASMPCSDASGEPATSPPCSDALTGAERAVLLAARRGNNATTVGGARLAVGDDNAGDAAVLALVSRGLLIRGTKAKNGHVLFLTPEGRAAAAEFAAK